MPTNITTELLGEHPALELIATELELSASWIRGSDGLIGFGEWKSTSVKGKNRFVDARKWWHEQLATLKIQNTVHGSGTGPVLFTSFSFSPDDVSVLVIPQVVVGTKSGKSWITWIGSDPQPVLKTAPDHVSNGAMSWNEQPAADEAWKSRVATAVARIQNGDLDKVVLARDITVTSTKSIDPRAILNRLADEYPTTWKYSISGLVGATPELLLRLSRGMVTSRVLAGTISKTGDDAKDLALAASLARSSKDLAEHEYAVRSVAEAIEPFCSSTNVPESPFVLHLANVMHLATDVTGALVETLAHIDAFTILEQLHPSAAVCGTPRPKAAALIQEIEGMSRGRYAGPVGWIDAAGDGELGIALRCGQINGDTIRIFAGCGIVDGSDPEVELAETYAKFAPMRSALK